MLEPTANLSSLLGDRRLNSKVSLYSYEYLIDWYDVFYAAGSAASVLQGEIGRQNSAGSSVEQNFTGTVVATHFAYTNQSANQIHYHLLFAQNRTWMLQQFNVSGTETSSQGWAIETATNPNLEACLGLINPGDVIMRAAPYLNPTRLFLFITGRAERNGLRCPNYYQFTLFDRFRVDAGSSTFDAVSPAGQVTYWINGRQRCNLRLTIENGDSFLSCGSRSETWNAQALAVKEDSYSILYVATPGWIFAHPFMSVANSSIPLEDMVVDSMIALDNQLLWTATDVFGNSYTYLADYNSFAASWNHTTVTPTADSRSVDLFPEMLGFMIAFIVCAVFMVIGWTLFIVLKVRMSRTRVSRVELNERLISSSWITTIPVNKDF